MEKEKFNVKEVKRIGKEYNVSNKQVIIAFELMYCYVKQLEESQGEPSEKQFKKMCKIAMEVYKHG